MVVELVDYPTQLTENEFQENARGAVNVVLIEFPSISPANS